MRKLEKHIILLALLAFITTMFLGYTSQDNTKYIFGIALLAFIATMFIGYNTQDNIKYTFGIEQFQNEMKLKNYNFELQAVGKDFLPTTRKRMIIGNEALDIYLFSSNKKMENKAKFIDSYGSGYNNGSRAMKVSWIAPPHFYKRGNIIVQYVGGNKKITSDLKSIFGEQFAGQE